MVIGHAMEVWGFGPQADLICATGAHRSSSSTGKRTVKKHSIASSGFGFRV